jgi:predicted lipoprotein with Yx(FWY)xxD motif
MFLNGKTVSVICALATFAWVGCSEESSAPSAATTVAGLAGGQTTVGETELVTDEETKRPRRKTTIRIQDSDYGSVLFDGGGRALYLFTADNRRRSNCDGACADAWPPLIARGKLRGRGGADQALLGTVKRSKSRRQVTYAGHPLYRYIDDPRHEILCHNVTEFGGDWLVVQRSGEPAP